ncbi:hypothetical protein [Saccharospirillum sp.]|uniref:hypothetical protein n=1 Tax=Saccharospirillum sp. TaxID=2033801 RepID=UPI0034A0545C
MENNSEEWKEVRARVDTLSNSVFLLAGGAITLSSTALFNVKGSSFSDVIPSVSCLAFYSWYSLLASITLFVLLKAHLLLQAYSRLNSAKYYSSTRITNRIGWFIGLAGTVSLTTGLILLVVVANRVLNA